MQDTKQKGSVTVFLSLVLVLVIAIFAGSLESAHMMAARSHIAVKSDAAMDALMSRYELALFDKFRILALNSRIKPVKILKKELEDYENTDYLLLRGHDFLLSELDTVEINNQDYQYLMDNDCKPFQKEVNEIAADDLVLGIKDKLVSYAKSLQSYGKVTTYTNQLLEHSSELSSLVELLEDLYKDVELVNSKKSDLEKAVLDLLSVYGIYDPKVDQETWDDVKPKLIKLHDLSNNLKTANQQIQKKLKSYITSADKLAGLLDTIMDDLEKSDLEEPYKSNLVKQFESFSAMLCKDGYVYDGVMESLEKCISNGQIFEQFEMPDWARLKSEEITGELIEESLKNIKGKMEKSVLLKLERLEKRTSEKSGLSAWKLISTVKKLIKNGSYSLFVDNIDTLSKRQITMKEYPSASNKNKLTQLRNLFSQPALETGMDAARLNYYLYEYMECYTDKGNYNLEYVIGNSKSDKENLKSSINQLVLLRQAANFLYLVSDTEKKAQAKAAATTMFAITGNILIIEAVTVLILSAWAFAEAVYDVRSLLNNGEIPFIKSKASFRLSLENAVDINQWKKAEKESSLKRGVQDGKNKLSVKVDEWNKLNYKQYLCLLLFFHFPGSNRYRCLDVIQWEVMQYDKEFLISDCIYGLSASMDFTVKPVFLGSGIKSGVRIPSSLTMSKKEFADYGGS